MQQLNTKTVPVNLAAAIQIVSQVIRRRQKRDESTSAPAEVGGCTAIKCNRHSRPRERL